MGSYEHGNEPSGFIKGGSFMTVRVNVIYQEELFSTDDDCKVMSKGLTVSNVEGSSECDS
jgi:hypothetical protein